MWWIGCLPAGMVAGQRIRCSRKGLPGWAHLLFYTIESDQFYQIFCFAKIYVHDYLGFDFSHKLTYGFEGVGYDKVCPYQGS